ncbi:MAG: class I SAM-dependent methyltransferase [Aliidongia sp.]
MADKTHDAVVTAQFGPRAAAYVTSEVHAKGEDLVELAQLAARQPGARVLDLGCGGGHVGFAVAAQAREVVAFDLSDEMLAAVEHEAAARGIGNIRTAQGSVTSLPFADGSFDVVLCRYSAHHWPDLAAGLAEARRVVRPGGIAAFADTVSPAAALLDTHLQAVELLRDPSHVRDYAIEQWRQALIAAGFAPGQPTLRRLRLEFGSWIARMQTAEAHRCAIRSLQDGAPAVVRRHFAIEPDGSFTVDKMLLTAEPA